MSLLVSLEPPPQRLAILTQLRPSDFVCADFHESAYSTNGFNYPFTPNFNVPFGRGRHILHENLYLQFASLPSDILRVITS